MGIFKKILFFGNINIDRKKSLIRSKEVDMIAIDDMDHKSKVRTGFSDFSKKIYLDTKNKILNELDAFFTIMIEEGSLKKSSPSNIYPILNRLEDLNLIVSELKVKNNKKIKYFGITDDGVHVLNYMYSRFDIIHNNPQWKLLFDTMD